MTRCPARTDQVAARAAHAVAEEMRRLLAQPAPDPPLVVDPGLRPEGRQGPLVRTLASYRAYYERWSLAWEAQALLRADPAAGDRELGERFKALADEFRYPAGGISAASVLEIRRLKARMEAERMPRGTDPAMHLKLGPGGLSDVEWVVQLLQLTHAHEVPALRTTRTLTALRRGPAGGPDRPGGRGRAGRLVAAGDPDPQRGGAAARTVLRRAPRQAGGAGGGGPDPRLLPGRQPGPGRGLPAHRAPGPRRDGAPLLRLTAAAPNAGDRGAAVQPAGRRPWPVLVLRYQARIGLRADVRAGTGASWWQREPHRARGARRRPFWRWAVDLVLIAAAVVSVLLEPVSIAGTASSGWSSPGSSPRTCGTGGPGSAGRCAASGSAARCPGRCAGACPRPACCSCSR